MTELFSLNEATLLFLFLINTISFGVQMLYTISAFIPPKEKVFEISLSLYLGFLSVLVRAVVNGFQSGRVNTLFFEPYHLFMLGLVFVVAVFTMGRDRKYRVISALVLGILSFPIPGTPFGLFSRLFIVSQLGFFARGTGLYFLNLNWRKKNITPYTFKEAFDTQHIGALFFDKSYNILLINQKMQELMESVIGHNLYDAKVLDEKLQTQVADTSNLIYEAPNGIIWKIDKTPIILKKKEIFQLIATDITDQAKIISRLSEVEEQLRLKKNELLSMMNNLEEIKKQEALQKSWHYIHDRMGQQVSMIQRLLHRKQRINQEELLTLIGNLEQQFSIEEENPDTLLQEIKQDYKNLGIEIHQNGELPEGALAMPLVEMIRECVTNSVRHGMAKNIAIEIFETDQCINLIVTNDGEVPVGRLKWGNGLTGIAEKARAHGGELSIETSEKFTVLVRLNKQ